MSMDDASDAALPEIGVV